MEDAAVAAAGPPTGAPHPPSGDPLAAYRAKRDLAATPEPDAVEAAPPGPPRFVVQEHHAKALHWDLRLERDGVLVSWAVPKGVPTDPRDVRLAVPTEDHPVGYLGFEGEIPRGEYGAGRVSVWDRGTYEPETWTDEKVVVRLRGRRVDGRYALFRTGARQWMMRRLDAPAKDVARMPRSVAPMLAKPGRLPPADGWAYEVKWDGARVLAFVEGGRVRLLSRNLHDVTHQYPELAPLGRELGSKTAVLDGEVVAFDGAGRPSFSALQTRLGVADAPAAKRRMAARPVTYMIFDLLFLDGVDLARRPYFLRRAALEALRLHGPAWETPPYHTGDGAAMVAATREQGLEGVVAKRLDSRYEAGRRTGAWLKVKNQRRQDVVVGGWTEGEGGRGPTLGALLVGVPDARGRLIFSGGVGTGYSDAALDALRPRLAALERPSSPFSPDGPAPPAGARFVEPRLVASVEFTGWTPAGMLRHPSFKGLREDVDPADVVREEV